MSSLLCCVVFLRNNLAQRKCHKFAVDGVDVVVVVGGGGVVVGVVVVVVVYYS